jgi:hypothetical protein
MPATANESEAAGPTREDRVKVYRRADYERGVKQEVREKNLRHPIVTNMLGIGRVTTEGLMQDEARGMDKAIEAERAKPLVGKLTYSLEGSGDPVPVELSLRGTLEEAQEFALKDVVAAESGPNMDLVRGAQVTLPDGTSQSWHEFTAPALERLQAAQAQQAGPQ